MYMIGFWQTSKQLPSTSQNIVTTENCQLWFHVVSFAAHLPLCTLSLQQCIRFRCSESPCASLWPWCALKNLPCNMHSFIYYVSFERALQLSKAPFFHRYSGTYQLQTYVQTASNIVDLVQHRKHNISVDIDLWIWVENKILLVFQILQNRQIKNTNISR